MKLIHFEPIINPIINNTKEKENNNQTILKENYSNFKNILEEVLSDKNYYTETQNDKQNQKIQNEPNKYQDNLQENNKKNNQIEANDQKQVKQNDNQETNRNQKTNKQLNKKTDKQINDDSNEQHILQENKQKNKISDSIFINGFHLFIKDIEKNNKNIEKLNINKKVHNHNSDINNKQIPVLKLTANQKLDILENKISAQLTNKKTNLNQPIVNLDLEIAIKNSKNKKDAKKIIEELLQNIDLKENKANKIKISHQELLNKENLSEVKQPNESNKISNKIDVYIKPELKIKENLSKNNHFEQKEFSDKSNLNHFFQEQIQTKHIMKEHFSQSIKDQLQDAIKDALEEIISKAKIQLGKDHFSAQIRLNPSIFGFMSVDMRYENGSIILKILVDNNDVFKKLQDNIESIKSEFAKQGISLDQLHIKFKESANQFQQNQQDQNFMFDFQNSQKEQNNNYYFEQAKNDSIFIENETNIQKEKEDIYDKKPDKEYNYGELLSMNTNQRKEYWG
ncbi:MAG: hypothetical protein KatS3mg129_0640 [Leptospiraceae bacterium]|nr:MAG: hypothetical protein KatS3mg129_0640 [Leptospiraceae bacterium]